MFNTLKLVQKTQEDDFNKERNSLRNNLIVGTYHFSIKNFILVVPIISFNSSACEKRRSATSQ